MGVMSRGSTRNDRAYARVGGHIALDLLNTVKWRLDAAQRCDDLTSYEQVVAWAQQVGLVSDQEGTELASLAGTEPRWAESELDQFRRMRETAYAALLDDSSVAVAELAAGQRAALQRAQLTKVGTHWAWAEPTLTLTTPRDRTVRQVIDLLTSPELSLLYQCEDNACGWVYLDTSPRQNRRWCVAADCGNRNRARRFYAKQQASRAATR